MQIRGRRVSGESSKKNTQEVMLLRACKAGRTVGHRPFMCAWKGGTLRGAGQCAGPGGQCGAAGRKRDGGVGRAAQTSGPGAALWAGQR